MRKDMTFRDFLLAILIGVVVLLASAAIFGWAWNNVVPEAFGGPVLTYGQSIALVIILEMGSRFVSNHSN